MCDAEEKEARLSIKFDFLTKFTTLDGGPEQKIDHHKRDWSVESPIRNDPDDYALDSDDSVYDSSYTNIDVGEDPMLRATRLKKLIRKNKNLSIEGRKKLKIRRNIIIHRQRKSNLLLKS